jgi:CRP-like cAMP-binding protein
MRIRSQTHRKVPGELFGFRDAKLSALVERLGTDVAVRRGTILSAEGLTPPQFIVVCEGQVELTRGGEPIGVVLAGGWFGHRALLSRATVESVTAVAIVPTRLYVSSRREFASLVSARPSVREKLGDDVASRMGVDAVVAAERGVAHASATLVR